MVFLKIIATIFFVPLLDGKIYLLNTFDSPSVELYDCILHDGLYYCRRPRKPMVLNRNIDQMQCYHHGVSHSFAGLHQRNFSLSTILHEWKSSIEKAEEYSRYRTNPKAVDGYICQCIEPQSFGKNCEYILPMGRTFAETLSIQRSMKQYHPSYIQLYGDIISYETLRCDAGLLGLDWRDICDGLQQCMAGLDEENCDLLEFNECDEDEYRCMNGMCIPEEYFLDGEFDCLDWTDEIQYFDDADCPIEAASIQCDDRMCPWNEFSCGDGQCIADRLAFQKLEQIGSRCRSKREQYFLCETHYLGNMWSLSNGRCYENGRYNESNNTDNLSRYQNCTYLLRCALSGGFEVHCPCSGDSCRKHLNNTCSSAYIPYPNAGIMAPYILFVYNRTRSFARHRPDFYWLNGSIKCHGMAYEIPNPTRFSNIFTLSQIEEKLCRQSENNSSHRNLACDGYNQSLTFAGHRYKFTNQCNNWQKCLSSYRIRDGFVSCVGQMDETEVTNNGLRLALERMQKYRFRCSADQLTWLSVAALGNGKTNCQNNFDELWFGSTFKLIDINCKTSSKDQCHLLRQYIENSWLPNTNLIRLNTQLRIPFRQYCDTFWNLISHEDENSTDCNQWWVCYENQWRCGTGQCIDEEWVLDDIWDCSDGSDEDPYSEHLMSGPNGRVVSSKIFIKRSKARKRSIPFSPSCNPRREWPCLPKNFSGSLDTFLQQRPCIDRNRLGDGHIDCYGAIDERNTITRCNQSAMLENYFQCPSTLQCIPYWNHCIGDRCRVSMDDQFWCSFRDNLSGCLGYRDAVCFNGTCLKNKRCNEISDCPFGEDEYMCEYKNTVGFNSGWFREYKEIATRNTIQKLPFVSSVPTSSITVTTIGRSKTTTSTSLTATTTLSPESADGRTAFWCNRGVGMKLSNESFVCFCPPQYYGDKCQYHSDRILIEFHLDLTQSIYTIKTDIRIVLKILVVLLFNDEVIANQISHVRPATDMQTYVKKILHFPYSRSIQFLEYKQQRYFNRSKILNEHPFAIRFEIYERKDTGEPELSLVWQYPIYFDYLPVFRFAKVLRLTKPSVIFDPCSSNPCNLNQKCRQLQNNKSHYICLCKSNFTGPDCLEENSLCVRGYCAHQSICKPNYLGSLVGNQSPFCLCHFDFYGDRCGIRHDRCSSNPCLNGGSCYATGKPDVVSCVCTDEYYGKSCEFRKPEVQLFINESVEHFVGVVQYLNIDFVSLNLLLSDQQLYRSLPSLLQYRHRKEIAPELIIVKIYSSSDQTSSQLYLISLQMNAGIINTTTQLNEQTQCLSLASLNSSYIPIQYHRLCQQDENLYCFEDGWYLCVCTDDHSRVECFGYDFLSDRCPNCLSDGICVQGSQFDKNDFICLCPRCRYGSLCQFSIEGIAFTLDSLVVQINRSIRFVYFTFAFLIFMIGGMNNYATIVTSNRPNVRKTSIGIYMIILCLISQYSLFSLLMKIVLTLFDSLMTDLSCKIISYLHSLSIRCSFWLTSWIAIDRLSCVLFPFSTALKKPRIAILITCATIIVVGLMHVHEIIFYRKLVDLSNQSMCTIDLSKNFRLYDRVTVLTHYLIPFSIQILSITILIVLAARSRSRSGNSHDSFSEYFKRQFKLQKDLYTSPLVIIVSGLPHAILSFSFACMQLITWQQHALLIAYFLSFAPQLLGFIVFVLPSSLYLKEFEGTKLSKTILFRWMILKKKPQRK